MISSLKTDLIGLADLINSGISNPSTSNNTKEYQICLDLLTNMPLAKPMTSYDFYNIFNRSAWIQSTDKDSSFQLSNIVNKPSNNTIDIRYGYSSDMIKTKSLTYYNISYTGKDAVEYIKSSDETKDNIKHPYGGTEWEIDLPYISKSRGPLEQQYIYSKTHQGVPIDSTMFQKQTINILLDHRQYDEFQTPSNKLNYYIKKSPFILKESIDSPIISSSNQSFPKLEFDYDIIVYPDKLVYLTASKLNAICTYKSFSIPSLELLESGSDIKLKVYNKLNLTRQKIVGPNAIKSGIKDINIIGGFKIYNNQLYDLFMNSVRIAEHAELKYYNISLGNHMLSLYY